MKKARISIKGLPVLSDCEEDSFELMTDGEYSRKDGISTFSYVESELTGFDGMQTTFNVEPDRIVLSRDGGLSGDMIFSVKQKHHFLYDTPFGAIMLGIDTHSIKKSMRDDGGSIEIRYNIEVDNATVSQNLFKIKVKTYPQ